MAVKSPTTDSPPITGHYTSQPPKPDKASLLIVIGKSKARPTRGKR
jgi:hypothetical protein